SDTLRESDTGPSAARAVGLAMVAAAVSDSRRVSDTLRGTRHFVMRSKACRRGRRPLLGMYARSACAKGAKSANRPEIQWAPWRTPGIHGPYPLPHPAGTRAAMVGRPPRRGARPVSRGRPGVFVALPFSSRVPRADG